MDLKRDLLRQGLAANGWTAREMTLMMTGSDDFSHSPMELHDNYRLNRDVTLTLQLTVHFSLSEDRNNSNDNSNNG